MLDKTTVYIVGTIATFLIILSLVISTSNYYTEIHILKLKQACISSGGSTLQSNFSSFHCVHIHPKVSP